ncbi:MAG: OmpA family protein [Myxococcota bacterium]
MHVVRNPSRAFGLLAAGFMLLTSTACGPIVFSDDASLAIVGTAPPPEPEPVAEPAPEPQKRVEVRDNKILIKEKIQFAVNSDKIQEVSFDLLNEVAKVIKDNPQIKKIEIQGHASAEGGDQHNMRLSDRRAKAVKKYLTSKGGVQKGELSAKGYGETQPIASNDTEDGREKNRRVEFVITEQEVTQTKVEIDDSGNEKVLEEKKISG